MDKFLSPRKDVSLIFCGIGDGRHLFMTILLLAHKATDRKIFKDAHITVVDHNPAVIARLIILFDMIQCCGLSQNFREMRERMGRSSSEIPIPGPKDADVILAYIYSTWVMPHAVNDCLRNRINFLVSRLETDQGHGKFKFIPATTRAAVLHVLREWQKPMTEIHQEPGFIRRTIKKRLDWLRHCAAVRFGKPVSYPEGLERDNKTMQDLGVLLPSREFAERHDPELARLMDAYRAGAPLATDRLAEHIDATWATNVTLLSPDLASVEKRTSVEPYVWESSDEQKVPHFDKDPCQLAQNFPDTVGKSAGVIQTLARFFEKLGFLFVRSSAMPTSSNIMVEIIVGELADTMERIRWNCLETRANPVGGIDPSAFPRTYDRIHMSNVPEYAGGLLTAAMYGRPLFREDKRSQLRFSLSMTIGRFPSREHYLSEYMLMHDEKRIADHFALVQNPEPTSIDISERLMTPEAREAWLRESGADFMGFNISGALQIWEKSAAGQIPHRDRLTRPQLEKWLHGHFFKIILPQYRDWSEDFNASEGQQPLNLTAFIRLVCLMSERGYPAHWLSDILRALCGVGPDGDITTTARPPVQPFATPEEVDLVHPPHRMTLAPWKTEFTTLLSIWSRLLPFGFFAPESLVPLIEVAEYSVTFPAFDPFRLRVPHFILMFWDRCLLNLSDIQRYPLIGMPEEHLTPGRFQGVTLEPPDDQIERMLQDDEQGEDVDIQVNQRRKGVHVFTAMKFVTATRSASFWCRRDVMEKMRGAGDRWKVYIYRTDTWNAVMDVSRTEKVGVKVKDGVTEVRRWTE